MPSYRATVTANFPFTTDIIGWSSPDLPAGGVLTYDGSDGNAANGCLLVDLPNNLNQSQLTVERNAITYATLGVPVGSYLVGFRNAEFYFKLTGQNFSVDSAPELYIAMRTPTNPTPVVRTLAFSYGFYNANTAWEYDNDSINFNFASPHDGDCDLQLISLDVVTGAAGGDFLDLRIDDIAFDLEYFTPAPWATIYTEFPDNSGSGASVLNDVLESGQVLKTEFSGAINHSLFNGTEIENVASGIQSIYAEQDLSPHQRCECRISGSTGIATGDWVGPTVRVNAFDGAKYAAVLTATATGYTVWLLRFSNVVNYLFLTSYVIPASPSLPIDLMIEITGNVIKIYLDLDGNGYNEIINYTDPTMPAIVPGTLYHSGLVWRTASASSRYRVDRLQATEYLALLNAAVISPAGVASGVLVQQTISLSAAITSPSGNAAGVLLFQQIIGGLGYSAAYQIEPTGLPPAEKLHYHGFLLTSGYDDYLFQLLRIEIVRTETGEESTLVAPLSAPLLDELILREPTGSLSVEVQRWLYHNGGQLLPITLLAGPLVHFKTLQYGQRDDRIEIKIAGQAIISNTYRPLEKLSRIGMNEQGVTFRTAFNSHIRPKNYILYRDVAYRVKSVRLFIEPGNEYTEVSCG